MLKPPEYLHQVSNLQYQRCAPEVIDTEKTNLSCCSSEISFSFQPSVGIPSRCPSDDVASRALTPENAIIIRSTNVPYGCSAADCSPLPAEDSNSCMVCLERPSNAVLLECGHSGVCVDCACALWAQSRRCPVCRKGFAAVVRIVDRQGSAVRGRTARESPRCCVLPRSFRLPLALSLSSAPPPTTTTHTHTHLLFPSLSLSPSPSLPPTHPPTLSSFVPPSFPTSPSPSVRASVRSPLFLSPSPYPSIHSSIHVTAHRHGTVTFLARNRRAGAVPPGQRRSVGNARPDAGAPLRHAPPFYLPRGFWLRSRR